MNIIIVGCGRVGRKLVQMLESLGHDIAVVDENPDYVAALSERVAGFSGMAVVGVPIDVDVLRSAGIEACDAVAAVTQEDNINLMVAQMATRVFGVKNVIARVTDPARKEVFSERFDMRLACGTNLTAQAILAGLLREEDDEDQCVIFGSSTANFSCVDILPAQLGQALETVQPPRAGMLVFGVQRANGTLELATTPSPILHRGDKIVYSELAD